MHDGGNEMAALIRRMESLLDEAPASLRSGGLAGQRCFHGALEDLEEVLRAMRGQAEQADSSRQADGKPADTLPGSGQTAEKERLRRVLLRCRKSLEQSQEVLSHLQRWADARRAEGGLEQNYGEGAGRGPGAMGNYGRGAAAVLPMRGSLEAHG